MACFSASVGFTDYGSISQAVSDMYRPLIGTHGYAQPLWKGGVYPLTATAYSAARPFQRGFNPNGGSIPLTSDQRLQFFLP